MAKLFGDYIPEEGYNAFMMLLDLTKELEHKVSREEAEARYRKGGNFPAPSDFNRWMVFNDFFDAANKAFERYLKELPSEGGDEEKDEAEAPLAEAEAEAEAAAEAQTEVVAEAPTDVKAEAIIEPPAEAATETESSPEEEPQDEPEPPSEEEPQDEPEPPSEEKPQDDPESSPEEAPREDYDPSDTECDPFDEGPDSPLNTGIFVPSPMVSLTNYLFNCLVRIPDPGSKSGYFYAENSGFYAEASEPDDKTTETKYIARSSIEDTYNLFTVKRPNPPILEIVSQEYDEQIRVPFPGPRKDICYIVSKPFAEAARAAGRTTDDLIYIEDYERITGTKYNEILVKEFRGL